VKRGNARRYIMKPLMHAARRKKPLDAKIIGQCSIVHC
jgi:hypothetical protein